MLPYSLAKESYRHQIGRTDESQSCPEETSCSNFHPSTRGSRISGLRSRVPGELIWLSLREAPMGAYACPLHQVRSLYSYRSECSHATVLHAGTIVAPGRCTLHRRCGQWGTQEMRAS